MPRTSPRTAAWRGALALALAAVCLAVAVAPAEAASPSVRARQIARRHVIEPSLRAGNQRYGRLTLLRERTTRRKQARRLIDEIVADRRLDAAQARELHAELDVAPLEAIARDERLSTGSRRWWAMLHRVSGMRALGFSRMDLVPDGPAFRREAHEMVDQADGFLHISGLSWNDDAEGEELARRIVARKLRLPYDELVHRLETEPIEAIRDRQLARAAAAREAGVARGAPIDDAEVEAHRVRIAAQPEARRAAMVGELLDPLEVRVLLSAMYQLRHHRGQAKPGHLRALDAVGAPVVLDEVPLRKRFPFVDLASLYSVVPHAKMMVSGTEGLAGGHNYGGPYMQGDGEPLAWRDTSVRFAGELAHGYTRSFTAHWNRAVARRGRDHLAIADDPARYYPAPAGPQIGVGTLVGTEDLIDTKTVRYSHRTALAMALAGARKRVILTTPYLSSPWLYRQVAAAARRFDDPSQIVLLLTTNVDSWITRRPFNAHYVEQLRKLGVTVLDFAPDPTKSNYLASAMSHAKAGVIDDVAFVGSPNGTGRSLTQDWELATMSSYRPFVDAVHADMVAGAVANSIVPEPLAAPVRYLGWVASLITGPILRMT